MFPTGADYYVQSEVDYRREVLTAAWGRRHRARRARRSAARRRPAERPAPSQAGCPEAAPAGTARHGARV